MWFTNAHALEVRWPFSNWILSLNPLPLWGSPSEKSTGKRSNRTRMFSLHREGVTPWMLGEKSFWRPRPKSGEGREADSLSPSHCEPRSFRTNANRKYEAGQVHGGRLSQSPHQVAEHCCPVEERGRGWGCPCRACRPEAAPGQEQWALCAVTGLLPPRQGSGQQERPFTSAGRGEVVTGQRINVRSSHYFCCGGRSKVPRFRWPKWEN